MLRIYTASYIRAADGPGGKPLSQHSEADASKHINSVVVRDDLDPCAADAAESPWIVTDHEYRLFSSFPLLPSSLYPRIYLRAFIFVSQTWPSAQQVKRGSLRSPGFVPLSSPAQLIYEWIMNGCISLMIPLFAHAIQAARNAAAI